MWCHPNEVSFIHTASLDACYGLAFEEKCEESATVCEALFVTSGATCDTHCKSLQLSCQEAWDETSKTCASKLTADARRLDDGCRMSYNDQICRCTTGGRK